MFSPRSQQPFRKKNSLWIIDPTPRTKPRLHLAPNTNTLMYLEGSDGSRLETQICLEILCDFSDQSLEWQFSDQQLGGLLVSADFSECHCSGTVTMRLLHAARGGGGLPGRLGGELLPGGFSSRGLTSGLLRTSHFVSLQHTKLITAFPPKINTRDGNSALGGRSPPNPPNTAPRNRAVERGKTRPRWPRNDEI